MCCSEWSGLDLQHDNWTMSTSLIHGVTSGMSTTTTTTNTKSKKNNLQSTIILNDAETQERKQWLEDIERYQRKKDVECILEHGFGYHWDILASKCVAD
jgi:hypothetical protein